MKLTKLQQGLIYVAIFYICLFTYAFAGTAHATPGNNGGGNGGCGQGQQTNGCGGTVNSPTAGGGTGVGLGIAGAAAGAISGSTSGAKADSSSGALSGSASSANGKVENTVEGDHVQGDKTFVAPAPVFTIAPASSGGIVTKSHAAGLIWNAFSWSKSEQMTDPFQGGMRLVNEYERLCQFETAAIIRQRLYALLDPSFRELPAQPGVRNLTPSECAAAAQ